MLIVSDDFPYADGDLHGRNGWATCSSFGNLNVASNKVKPNTGAADGAACIPGFTGLNYDQWAQLTLSTFADFIGPTVFNNGVGSFYFCDCRSTSTVFYRINNAVFTALLSVSTVGWATSEIPWFRGVYNGSTKTTLLIYKGGAPGVGTLVGTLDDTDPARLVSGTPGMRMWHADANARISTFRAGDSTSALPPSGKHWNSMSGLSGMTGGGRIEGMAA